MAASDYVWLISNAVEHQYLQMVNDGFFPFGGRPRRDRVKRNGSWPTNNSRSASWSDIYPYEKSTSHQLHKCRPDARDSDSVPEVHNYQRSRPRKCAPSYASSSVHGPCRLFKHWGYVLDQGHDLFREREALFDASGEALVLEDEVTSGTVFFFRHGESDYSSEEPGRLALLPADG